MDRDTERFRLPTGLDIQALLRDLVEAGTVLTLKPEATATHAHGPSCEVRLVSQDGWQDRIVLAPVSPMALSIGLPGWLESRRLHASGQINRVDIHLEINALALDADGHSWVAAYPFVAHRYQRREGFRVEPLGGAAVPRASEPGAAAHADALSAADDAPLPLVELTLFGADGDAQALAVPVLDLSHHGAGLFISDARAAAWPAGAPVLALGATLHAVWLALESDLGMRVSLRVVHETACVDARQTPPEPGRRMGCEIEGLSEVQARELQRHLIETQRRRNHATVTARAQPHLRAESRAESPAQSPAEWPARSPA
ncbi:MAG: hypothetical protein AB9M60_16345 [Leptothrix sp. (in: b-proteobacteria)]